MRQRSRPSSGTKPVGQTSHAPEAAAALDDAHADTAAAARETARQLRRAETREYLCRLREQERAQHDARRAAAAATGGVTVGVLLGMDVLECRVETDGDVDVNYFVVQSRGKQKDFDDEKLEDIRQRESDITKVPQRPARPLARLLARLLARRKRKNLHPQAPLSR